MRFIGIDLGWISQPTGLAIIDPPQVVSTARIDTHAGVLEWIDRMARGPAMLAIDAPLVIPNPTGIRQCEREVNSDYRRFHAGCHAANQGRPFYAGLRDLVTALEDRGFAHAPTPPSETGRYMIEVHPHAATVSLFGLDRIVKYKKGRVAERREGLTAYRGLLATLVGPLPTVPRTGIGLKAAEDQLDAINAAYTGWLWATRGNAACRCYGNERNGYIVIPHRGCVK